MMFNCILVLALALFGTSAALIPSTYATTGYNNLNGVYGTCGTTVADTCRCVKTVVRPHIGVGRYIAPTVTSVMEHIPYSVSRRVDSPTYAGTSGIFPGHVLSTGGSYVGGAYSTAGLGLGYGNVLY